MHHITSKEEEEECKAQDMLKAQQKKNIYIYIFAEFKHYILNLYFEMADLIVGEISNFEKKKIGRFSKKKIFFSIFQIFFWSICRHRQIVISCRAVVKQ